MKRTDAEVREIQNQWETPVRAILLKDVKRRILNRGREGSPEREQGKYTTEFSDLAREAFMVGVGTQVEYLKDNGLKLPQPFWHICGLNKRVSEAVRLMTDGGVFATDRFDAAVRLVTSAIVTIQAAGAAEGQFLRSVLEEERS